jgi:tRNA(Arg) A34 adenosine deaminase TadA
MELNHDDYMDRAIALALRKPGAPFGALVVAAGSGEVLAEGVNSVEDSPTRHGEMVAIDAWAAAHGSRGEGHLVLYTTAEPCPMCMAAALWARIEVVVFGSSIPHLVRTGWNQIEIRAAEIARCTPFADCRLIGGVRKAECDRLFANPPDADL